MFFFGRSGSVTPKSFTTSPNSFPVNQIRRSRTQFLNSQKTEVARLAQLNLNLRQEIIDRERELSEAYETISRLEARIKTLVKNENIQTAQILNLSEQNNRIIPSSDEYKQFNLAKVEHEECRYQNARLSGHNEDLREAIASIEEKLAEANLACEYWFNAYEGLLQQNEESKEVTLGNESAVLAVDAGTLSDDSLAMTAEQVAEMDTVAIAQHVIGRHTRKYGSRNLY